MQKWEQWRYRSTADATLSLIFRQDDEGLRHVCYAVEDEHRDVKVPGETRIPAGTYEVKLRREGGMHARYQQRFGEDHRGMLHLQDVPGFEWVYIHIGNAEDETEGCILPGKIVVHDGMRVGSSREAYEFIRMFMHEELIDKPAGQVFWTIRDLDRETEVRPPKKWSVIAPTSIRLEMLVEEIERRMNDGFMISGDIHHDKRTGQYRCLMTRVGTSQYTLQRRINHALDLLDENEHGKARFALAELDTRPPQREDEE